MLLAVDQIVTQAAKWRSMFGGFASAPVTVRGIINRGGEQGAQHSQSLQSWFAHIPGLRVVMPSTTADARDLLIASVLSDDPTLYIDDRWLYHLEDDLSPVADVRFDSIAPTATRYGNGRDCTLVGAGFGAFLCRSAAQKLEAEGIGCTVIDQRVINPLDTAAMIASVSECGRLLAVDADWRICGLAAEFIAAAAETVAPAAWRARPRRLTLPDAPAPTSGPLEQAYYFGEADVIASVRLLMTE